MMQRSKTRPNNIIPTYAAWYRREWEKRKAAAVRT